MVRQFVVAGAIVALATACGGVFAQVPVGTAFTYQGQLTRRGAPVNDSADMRFTLWDAESGGSSFPPAHSFAGIPASNGLFSVELDFGTWAFSGESRWLQIEVRSPAWDGTEPEPGFTELRPRQEITPTPYALALPGFWSQTNETSPNLMGGWKGNFVQSGVVGGTISGGGDPTDNPEYPDFNTVTDDFGTVGGGRRNWVGDFDGQTDNSTDATIGGGKGNCAQSEWATVGGGLQNTASGRVATVCGGSNNTAGSVYSTVGGGFDNLVEGDFATACGGERVRAEGQHAFAGGGWASHALGAGAVVCGGGSVPVGDGWLGMGNVASGNAATVPGGLGNWAAGDYSLAAGHRAEAAHAGTFVWADATNAPDTLNTFPSTGENQFLIRASGGVGMGTNAPESKLHVRGGLTVEGDYGNDSNIRIKKPEDLGLDRPAEFTFSHRSEGTELWLFGDGESGHLNLQSWDYGNNVVKFPADGDTLFVNMMQDRVGIGTSSPGEQLSVAGVVESTSGGFKFPDGTVQTTAGGAGSIWQSNSSGIHYTAGNVGIGTASPAGELALGDYQGGTTTSAVEEYKKQLVLAGAFNVGVNAGQSVKLLINEYDNDTGADIYPIYVEDENNSPQFYLRSREGTKTTYINGSVGIGTAASSSKLTVAGTIESTNGGIRFPDGTTQTTAAAGSGGAAWSLAGNSGTTTSHFLGTTDNASLSLRVNNVRGMLLQPRIYGPNLIGGYYTNAASAGVSGATVSGGGGKRNSGPSYMANTVGDDFGTIGGGWNNQAGDADGSTIDDEGATVAGGFTNTSSAYCSTVGGGEENEAGALGATVPGGRYNEAAGEHSLAAGYRAKSIHDGTFVWADTTESDFSSMKNDQFLIRASGGVGIGTANTSTFRLAVNGSAAKPGGGSWSVYSDARLKKNIEKLRETLPQLLKLRGVTFEYKNPGFKLGMPGPQIGMIAQEVEKVFPEWVDEDEDGYKYLTISGMEALVIEALRELREEKDAEIHALQSRIEALEAIVGKLADSQNGNKR
ncbi:MAG: tail fiber domain-containing protein [Phycisphaerales bacterium]|nr:MAG: tail fiber domain-containing protein [Phycisphaerales bacterium]